MKKLAFAMGALLAATGCGSSEEMNEVASVGHVGLAVSAPLSAASTEATEATGRQLEAGSDVLQLTSVRISVGEIELEAPDSECSDPSASCETVAEGPFIIEIPLDGQLLSVLEATIEPGVYEEIELELEPSPELDGASVQLTGQFNGEPFDVLLDIDEDLEIELDEPVEVGSDASGLTLSIDLDSWFINDAGELIDPRKAEDSDEVYSELESNIEDSFETFEDDDYDGEPDYDDDDEDYNDDDDDQDYGDDDDDDSSNDSSDSSDDSSGESGAGSSGDDDDEDCAEYPEDDECQDVNCEETPEAEGC